MDWIAQKEHLLESVKKYRYILLVLLIGVFLMMLPASSEAQTLDVLPAEQETEPDLQESLAQILSKVSGAGNVEVLLTQLEGESTLYQTNEDFSSGDVRQDTVIISNSDREETGLVIQINPPVYQGAIILCQGADNATVRLSIVEAVMSVTGLTSDHITVLKMN